MLLVHARLHLERRGSPGRLGCSRERETGRSTISNAGGSLYFAPGGQSGRARENRNAFKHKMEPPPNDCEVPRIHGGVKENATGVSVFHEWHGSTSQESEEARKELKFAQRKVASPRGGQTIVVSSLRCIPPP